jgi:hypothetical protein
LRSVQFRITQGDESLTWHAGLALIGAVVGRTAGGSGGQIRPWHVPTAAMLAIGFGVNWLARMGGCCSSTSTARIRFPAAKWKGMWDDACGGASADLSRPGKPRLDYSPWCPAKGSKTASATTPGASSQSCRGTIPWADPDSAIRVTKETEALCS